MSRHLFSFVNNLRLRWKLLVVVLPLVVVPILVVGAVIGHIASEQAFRGLTQTSKDDLDHLADFTLDLLDAHYQQFQVYKTDKQKTIREELKTLTDLAYSLVEAQQSQAAAGKIDPETAKLQASTALKRVNVGETGYIYAMDSNGTLKVHLAREGENIIEERDEDGRYFIRAMCKTALRSKPGEMHYIIYPWRNETLGDRYPRRKIVAYRYFPAWDWIIATGGYLEETYEDHAFENRSLEELKNKIKSKKVGRTGYIFCMERLGTLTIHPEAEGENIIDARAQDGTPFIREMAVKKDGWIRYAWKAGESSPPKMKLVRYRYFKPWDWIVAVGAFEDEFYREANQLKGRISSSLAVIILLTGGIATGLVFLAAKVLSDPINHMTEVIRQVKRGRLDRKMRVDSADELGELAAAFNRMTEIIQRNKEMEATLAQQGKMASLGVLSSGVAHEINNPLGVILGYAGYLEGKIGPDDPHFKFISEIKRESKRCKKIVQDLLSYARTPKPSPEATDINALLGQIVDFAVNHTDMRQVEVVKAFSPDLPSIAVDPDQIRQVAINLILNAGSAMENGGRLEVRSGLSEGYVDITFIDNGSGIPEENLEKIFEPFFTTRTRGTGLGLAITRQIVDMHRGKISLESTVGRGTKVTVRLPIHPEDQEI